MKKVKINTVKKQIQDGRIECITDLKIGFVEILRFGRMKKRETIEVIA